MIHSLININKGGYDMILNNTTKVNVIKTVPLTEDQLNNLNNIPNINSNITGLQNSNIENLNNSIANLEAILKYDEIIGDEELTTTSKTLNAAINEINSK